MSSEQNKETYCHLTKKDLFKGLKANIKGHLECENCVFYDFCVSDLETVGIDVHNRTDLEESSTVVQEEVQEEVHEEATTQLGNGSLISLDSSSNTTTYINPFDLTEKVIVENNNESSTSSDVEPTKNVSVETSSDVIVQEPVGIVADPQVEVVVEQLVEAVAESLVEVVAESQVEAIAEQLVEVVAESQVENLSNEPKQDVESKSVNSVFDALEKVKIEPTKTVEFEDDELGFLNMEDEVEDSESSIVDTILSDEDELALSESYFMHKDTLEELSLLPKKEIF